LVFGAGLSSWASLFSSGTLNAIISDNIASGYANAINVSGVGSQLTDVTLNLNLSRGYNGDLVAWIPMGHGLCFFSIWLQEAKAHW